MPWDWSGLPPTFGAARIVGHSARGVPTLSNLEPLVSIPSVISIVVAVVGALFAMLTAGLSFGPGWRELREYSACAGLATLFVASNVFCGTSAPPHVLVLASRFSLLVAGLHGAAWFAYTAARERRALDRLEKGIAASGLIVGVVALVPGALVSDDVSVRPVAWLGWVYRDAVPTQLGGVGYAVYCGALFVLTYHYGKRWRRGEPYAAAHFFGLGALMVAGVNDSLTAARLYDAPNLLDLGFLTAVGCVGSALVARFVASARSLDAQTAQLKATQAALVQRERLAALGELSAVVAHEVRNPIAIMFNAIAVLRRTPQGGEAAGTLLGILDDEARRLMRIVNDLLAYASPGALRLTKAPLDSILSGAAEAAHAIAPAGAVGVRVHIPAELPALECDEQLVRQAVINLITNAMQASPRHPVDVRAELEPLHPQVVRIVVVDHGSGVPAESVPRLFTPFFTTRATGTGLGLAIVRRVAEAHGGDVRLAPPEGPGATFWLRLPVEAAGGGKNGGTPAGRGKNGRSTIPPGVDETS
jgi:two-component system sensor histidine kinase HydH